MADNFSKLKELLTEANIFASISGLLQWDQQVNLPSKGNEFRGEQLALLHGLVHKKMTSDELGNLLDTIKSSSEYDQLSEDNKILIDLTKEDYDKQKKIPLSLVEELSKVSNKAYYFWTEARKVNDFNVFMPHLQKVIDCNKKLADCLGYEKSPYDPLLDQFEKGLTVEYAKPLFKSIRNKLVPFIESIQNSNVKTSDNMLRNFYPTKEQIKFTEYMIKQMGFDFKKGRQDLSEHPFTIGIHPTDVRVTTRIDEKFLPESMSGSVHEAGHALYEQGILEEDFGGPIGTPVSFGIHESQSRLWENNIGRSKSFWKFFYPKLKEYFPKQLENLSLEKFLVAYNHVSPSLIRVDADEVTYNLHILLRFEIELAIMEGEIKIKELPELWNKKMEDYLKIKCDSDVNGVLQDVHWTSSIGYFPSYTLGNLYAAQIYHKLNEVIPDMNEQFEKGDFSNVLKWLNENIHKYGSRYKPNKLIKIATGENLSADYFINYIYDRYGEMYQIARMMI